MKVTARQQIRDATGRFGCPNCWSKSMLPLTAGTSPCPYCGIELEWEQETLDISEYWTGRKTPPK